MKQILLLILAAGVPWSCGQNEIQAPVNQVAQEEKKAERSREQQAWQLIQAGAQLIDVRSQAEYDAGHFDNVLLIAHDEILEGVTQHKIDKETPIVLYCKSGGRAERARMELENAGYIKVFNAGGYEAMLREKPQPKTP